MPHFKVIVLGDGSIPAHRYFIEPTAGSQLYHLLYLEVAAIVRNSPFVLSWKDIDNDFVALDSEPALQVALKLNPTADPSRALRVYVHTVTNIGTVYPVTGTLMAQPGHLQEYSYVASMETDGFPSDTLKLKNEQQRGRRARKSALPKDIDELSVLKTPRRRGKRDVLSPGAGELPFAILTDESGALPLIHPDRATKLTEILTTKMLVDQAEKSATVLVKAHPRLQTPHESPKKSNKTGQAYPCKHCGKVSKTSQLLKSHLRIHSDERPFGCHCGKAFKHQSNLYVHKKKLHNDQDPSRAAVSPPDNLDQVFSDFLTAKSSSVMKKRARLDSVLMKIKTSPAFSSDSGSRSSPMPVPANIRQSSRNSIRSASPLVFSSPGEDCS